MPPAKPEDKARGARRFFEKLDAAALAAGTDAGTGTDTDADADADTGAGAGSFGALAPFSRRAAGPGRRPMPRAAPTRRPATIAVRVALGYIEIQ